MSMYKEFNSTYITLVAFFDQKHFLVENRAQKSIYFLTPNRQYAFTAKELLADIEEPNNQNAPRLLLSTFNVKQLAILNSRVSCHSICLGAPITDKQIEANPSTVLQPDWENMVLTHAGDLDPPQLQQAAQQCQILPAIKGSLILVITLQIWMQSPVS